MVNYLCFKSLNLSSVKDMMFLILKKLIIVLFKLLNKPLVLMFFTFNTIN